MTDLEQLAHWINEQEPTYLKRLTDKAIEQLGFNSVDISRGIAQLFNSGAVDCHRSLFDSFYHGSELYFGAKSRFAQFLAFVASDKGAFKTINTLRKTRLAPENVISGYMYTAYNLGIVKFKEREDGNKVWYVPKKKYFLSVAGFPYLYPR